MEVERTIDVGFHSGFGAFERSKRSKIPTKLTIITDWDLYGIPIAVTIRSLDHSLFVPLITHYSIA